MVISCWLLVVGYWLRDVFVTILVFLEYSMEGELLS